MKPKQKYTLRLKNPQDVEELSSTTSAPTQKKQEQTLQKQTFQNEQVFAQLVHN